MDILITIAFLTLYYILGLGTVITLKTGLEEDVKLEGADYLGMGLSDDGYECCPFG